MKPCTLSLYPDCWHIDDGIPIARYNNHALFLPDGRRLMAGKTEFANHLELDGTRMQFSIPVMAKMVYQQAIFREGEQPWISITDEVEADQLLLVYFDIYLKESTIEPVVNEYPPTGYERINWLLPLQESYTGSASSHGGLAVLSPGQVATLLLRGQNSETKVVRVIATQHFGLSKLKLGYAI